MSSNLSPLQNLPDWLPDAVKLYLDHTEDGHSLRALARRDGCHASTVMRLVRRYEKRREDPLLDQALLALVQAGAAAVSARKDFSLMSAPFRPHLAPSGRALVGSCHRARP
jgi:lambda repressor-like predicted transcriptional regulator